VANVATLPGILKASLAMPDMHWGYGFPIGGVAAFDWESGIISPGGVGFDLNWRGSAGDNLPGLKRKLGRHSMVLSMRFTGASLQALVPKGPSNFQSQRRKRFYEWAASGPYAKGLGKNRI